MYMRWLRDIVIAVLIVGGGIYFLIAIGSTSSRAPAPQAPAGSDGKLSNGSPDISVAIDEEAAALTSSAGGRTFVVVEGTVVRVIESRATAQHVRIMSGAQKGKTGWVPSEWVKPLN